MTTPLVRNDIPEYGSPDWEHYWDDNSTEVMMWVDALKTEHELVGVWSLWEVRDFNAVPFPNAFLVEYQQFTISVKKGSTWLDLWKVAGELIKLSNDYHHIFVENFEPQDEVKSVLRLVCGS